MRLQEIKIGRDSEPGAAWQGQAAIRIQRHFFFENLPAIDIHRLAIELDDQAIGDSADEMRMQFLVAMRRDMQIMRRD